MGDVDYVEGFNILAHLGKGKAIVGMYVDGVATGETITTPFARCVPVVSPGDATVGHADNVLNVTESAGVVAIATSGTTSPTDFHVIILGDMY